MSVEDPQNMRDIRGGREISRERAEEALQRFSASHFRKDNERTANHARICIPVHWDDDDVVLAAVIHEWALLKEHARNAADHERSLVLASLQEDANIFASCPEDRDAAKVAGHAIRRAAQTIEQNKHRTSYTAKGVK